jgi:hypothetical protein
MYQRQLRLVGRRLGAIVAVLWLALAPMAVFAQTSTPTPTRTPTMTPTQTSTPTPVPNGVWATPIATPTFTAGQGMVWGCDYVVGDGAVQCTWGRLFSDFVSLTVNSGQSVQTRTAYLLLSPPTNTKLLDIECSWAASKTLPGTSIVSGNVKMGERSSVLLGGNQNDNVSTASGGSFHVLITKDPGSPSWSDWTTVPQGHSGSGLDHSDYPGLELLWSQSCAGTGCTTAGSSVVTIGYACEIIKVVLSDDSEYVPPANPQWGTATPTPTATVLTPTPTPTVLTCYIGCGEGTPFSDVTFEWQPFVPVSKTVEFEVGEPGVATCYTIIPGYEIDQTIFGYTIDTGWADFELCTQETSMSLVFMDVDVGAWLLVVLGVGGLGAAFKLFARSG